MRFRSDPSTRCEPCPVCGGTGGWSSRHRDERGCYEEFDPCDDCHGTGLRPLHYRARRRAQLKAAA